MAETLPTPTLESGGQEILAPPVPERKRILIVESDGFTRVVLIFLFRLAGFAVDFTSNAMLAEGKLRTSPHDALLLELKLPVVSGLELIRKARRDPQFGARPIYLFTHQDQIKRTIQEEVQNSVTRIFDKRTTIMEELLNSIVAELTGVQRPEPSSAKVAAKPAPEPRVNTVLPGNINEIIGGVQEECGAWLNSHKPGLEGCEKLLSRLRYLLSCAQAAGMRNLARQAKTLETLLIQFHDGGQKISEEELGTIGRAVELLSSMSDAEAKELTHFTVGVIDESPLSGGALSVALLKAGIKPVSFENPVQGLTHLASNPVELVIVNLSMPELHGFDSAQTNQFPQLSGTPVLFVSQPVNVNNPDWGEPSAAPLNANPRLLTEVVMKTLTELQRPGSRRTHAENASLPPGSEAQDIGESFLDGAPADTGELISSAPLKPWGQLIQARSKPLPTSEPPPEWQDVPSATRNEAEASEPSNPPTILFVESDPLLLEVYTKVLESAGFRVEAAGDGLAAFESLRLQPALVLLDLMLPQVDGLEVLQFIRGDTGLKDTPVIVLSNAYAGDLAGRALEAGANCGFSPTDCTPARLVQQVCEILGLPVPSPSLEAEFEVSEAKPSGNEDAFPETIWVRKATEREDAEAGQAEGSWLTEGDANVAQPQADPEHFAPVPEEAPEATEYHSAPANLSGESLQVGESYESPQAQDEAAANVSPEMATQRSTDEPYGAIRQGAAPVSETPDEHELQPAPEMKESENEWLAASTEVNAEPASFQQCTTNNDMNQNQSTPALESKVTDPLGFRPLRMTRQAEGEASFVAPDTGPELQKPSGAKNGMADLGNVPVPAAGPKGLNSGSSSLLELLKALQAESVKQRETMAKYTQERESLVTRLVNAENDLHHQGMVLETKDQQIAELQRKLDEFGEKSASTDSTENGESAEQSSQGTPEEERARGEAEKQAAEREAELRQQLEDAGAAAQENAAAHAQAQARCEQLEQELSEFHDASEEVKSQLAKEQQVNGEAAKRIKELEAQLQSGKDQTADLEQGISQRVAALTRLTADLAKERGERHRVEERAAALNKRLQELHADTRQLLESQRADQERLGQLESQLRTSEEALARQTTELEQLRAECRLAEEQLDQTSDLNADLDKHLSSFDVARNTLNTTQQELQSRLGSALNSLQESGSKLEHESAERERLAAELEKTQRELASQSRKDDALETKLQKTAKALQESESKLERETAERQRLAAALDSAQRELQNKGRNRDSLETDFNTASEALHEAESKLEQETAERQRLAQALEAAQRSQREQSQRAELELSKAQCALQFEQVERERLAAQAARLRHAALDAQRTARLQRNTWRKQIQAPVDNLYKTANNFLQLEMNEEQKKLAETILQDVLLVQNTFQEPENPVSDSTQPPGGATEGNSAPV